MRPDWASAIRVTAVVATVAWRAAAACRSKRGVALFSVHWTNGRKHRGGPVPRSFGSPEVGDAPPGVTKDARMSSAERYHEQILRHCEEPYHRGRLPGATHAHREDNPLCGDSVRLELRIDAHGVIAAAGFEGYGCCVSQAAASMLTQHIEGRTVEDISRLTAAEMLSLFGPRLTPQRQHCCLFTWRSWRQAVFSPIAST